MRYAHDAERCIFLSVFSFSLSLSPSLKSGLPYTRRRQTAVVKCRRTRTRETHTWFTATLRENSPRIVKDVAVPRSYR